MRWVSKDLPLAPLPVRDIDAARRELLGWLEAFGGGPAVRGRRVIEPG